MAGGKVLSLELDASDAAEWTQSLQNRGLAALGVPVGPIALLVPQMFHRFISKDTLKSYLCENEELSNVLRKKIEPADIPVIVKAYTEEVYPKVLDKLNDVGKIAVEEIHPWVLNTIIDWEDFDRVILKEDTLNNATGGDSVKQTDNNNNNVMACKDVSNVTEGLPCGNDRYHWTNDRVRKLIDLHSGYEEMFNKPSTKKITIWKKIAEDMNASSESSVSVTGVQCEQKWKNITKKFRDCVDHNAKSGNDRKECPFFQELNACYGYRPNVKPMYTCGSIEVNDSSTEEASTSSPTPTCSKPLPKRKRKADEVVSILKNMQEEMKADQEKMIEMLEKQHQDRIQQEEKKLQLLSDLVSSIKKSDSN